VTVQTPYSDWLEDPSVGGAIEELQQLIELEKKLSALPESVVSRPRENRRWTRKEELGHLIDSALNNHQRFVRRQIHEHVTPPYLEEGTLFTAGYAQDEWVRVGQYQKRKWRDLVILWVSLNKQVVHVMEYTDDADLYGAVVIDDAAPLQLLELMVDYVGHTKHHINQIFQDVGGSA
jgi:hypothetical protein